MLSLGETPGFDFAALAERAVPSKGVASGGPAEYWESTIVVWVPYVRARCARLLSLGEPPGFATLVEEADPSSRVDFDWSAEY